MLGFVVALFRDEAEKRNAVPPQSVGGTDEIGLKSMQSLIHPEFFFMQIFF